MHSMHMHKHMAEISYDLEDVNFLPICYARIIKLKTKDFTAS